MRVNRSQSFWVGVVIAFNLLFTSAYAEPDTAAANPTAPPVDPKKIMEQADTALNSQDLPEAMKLYFQAAELNYTPAQVVVGKFADSSQYYDAAVGWFIMAAMQGDAEGQYNLARMYQLGNGIEKDDSKASYWYRRSAAKNFVPAIKTIAVSYRTGALGMKVDLDQAQAWEAKAKRLEAVQIKENLDKLVDLRAQEKKIKEEEAARKAKAQ